MFSEKTFLLPANHIEIFCCSSNAERFTWNQSGSRQENEKKILHTINNFIQTCKFSSRLVIYKRNPHTSISQFHQVGVCFGPFCAPTLAQNSTQLCSGIGGNLRENSTFFRVIINLPPSSSSKRRDSTMGHFWTFRFSLAVVLSSSLSVFKRAVCVCVSVALHFYTIRKESVICCMQQQHTTKAVYK